MEKKVWMAFVAGVFLFGFATVSFAMRGKCGAEAANVAKGESEEVVNAGNKFCPVSGEKIDEKMKATYEYEGKMYNFCCPACIETFKKGPQKYIKKIEEEKAKTGSGTEKWMTHKKMCNKVLKELTEIIGRLNEVKNNPELKQRLETIVKEIKEMEEHCSTMMQKHEEEKEHKKEHEHHHGMM